MEMTPEETAMLYEVKNNQGNLPRGYRMEEMPSGEDIARCKDILNVKPATQDQIPF